MVFELRFADIGEGIHEGEILKWHVKEGEFVQLEQLLVEIQTEKVNAEITSPVAGQVTKIHKQEGEIINVGDILVSIETEVGKKRVVETGEAEKRAEKTEQTEEVDDSPLFKASKPMKVVRSSRKERMPRTGKVLASPAVRRLAREAGVDLQNIPGTGPGGRITREDLDSYLGSQTKKLQPRVSARTHVPGGEERLPLRGIRRTIANAMQKSKQTAAHFTLMDEVDMLAMDRLRKDLKPLAEQHGVKITYLPLIIKCLIPALKKYPYLNATIEDKTSEIIVKHYYNIGIAVDTEQGLMVPVIKNADQKTIWELAAEIKELAEKARSGKLTLDDVTGGTFSLTSIGNIGGVMATPVIRWPEVGILGIMQRKLRPVVIEENGKPEITIRPMMFLSLSCDHRLVDGAYAARFMKEVMRYIENPALLAFEEEL